ncbi:phage tail protein (plasmid) [Cereibacter azotoformans]|uniref:Phage tail-like protein n=2 Tax=Cereibacter TaxID=1653176 RepID=A0A2T5JUQ8_9RHOB|nr:MULTISPECIES: phage tail protein [Cereibacter]AXQ96267.1 phage tail protein [Cereibacter sphaeroides]PTR13895.1 phage tail-like protein [Cereibacter azotoformans]UIJ33174.1 phage tail protein [Cereibacter azotoformans]
MRNDPLSQFNFILQIDGLDSAGFTEVGGMNTESDIIEYREGNELATMRKLPGLVKYGNITLKRGQTVNRDLWEWRKTTLDGATQRKNCSITLLDEARQPAVRWNIYEAFVKKLEWPAMKSSANEAAIETVELVCERVELAE